MTELMHGNMEITYMYLLNIANTKLDQSAKKSQKKVTPTHPKCLYLIISHSSTHPFVNVSKFNIIRSSKI